MTLVMVDLDSYVLANLRAVLALVQPQLPDLQLRVEWPNSDGCYLYVDGTDDILTRIVVWNDSWISAWVGLEGEVGERVRIEDTEKLARLFVMGCKEEMQ